MIGTQRLLLSSALAIQKGCNYGTLQNVVGRSDGNEPDGLRSFRQRLLRQCRCDEEQGRKECDCRPEAQQLWIETGKLLCAEIAGEIGDRLAQRVQPLAVWRPDWSVEFALPAVVNHVDQARIKH